MVIASHLVVSGVSRLEPRTLPECFRIAVHSLLTWHGHLSRIANGHLRRSSTTHADRKRASRFPHDRRLPTRPPGIHTPRLSSKTGHSDAGTCPSLQFLETALAPIFPVKQRVCRRCTSRKRCSMVALVCAETVARKLRVVHRISPGYVSDAAFFVLEVLLQQMPNESSCTGTH
jgi:hypothetical protein